MPACHECRVLLIFTLILAKNETAAAVYPRTPSVNRYTYRFCVIKYSALIQNISNVEIVYFKQYIFQPYRKNFVSYAL